MSQEIKVKSKSVISDVNNRIDEALSEMISKRISDEIDARVRRCDPTLKDFE